MIDEAELWDSIHQKSLKQDETPSLYALEVEPLFPRSSILVELGAGTGNDALFFLSKGHKVIALDISSFALKTLNERAKRKGLSDNLMTRKMDFSYGAFPIKENSVDVVYSRISLNYFPRKRTVEIFSNIYKILKVGGRAFLTLKSPEDLNEMQRLKDLSLFEPYVFIDAGILKSRFPKEELERILKDAGIPNFSVSPYKEDLSKKEGVETFLYVNEVRFYKQ